MVTTMAHKSDLQISVERLDIQCDRVADMKPAPKKRELDGLISVAREVISDYWKEQDNATRQAQR